MQSGKSFQLVDLFPGDFDNFLRKNFKRVFDKVGCSLFKKLFGCAIVAPAPLPVSFISYVLQRDEFKIPKQYVLDALSLFMVLSKTFTFLHSLIPAWLTDEDKARERYCSLTGTLAPITLEMLSMKFYMDLSVSNLRMFPSLNLTCLTTFYELAFAF